MNVRIIKIAARLASLLPLPINHLLGSGLGKLAWWLNSKPRKITQQNLQLCFPSMEPAERKRLAKRSLEHTGRQLMECAWIWHRPPIAIANMIREKRGEQLLIDAISQPNGVLVVSPHIGNWELCSLHLSQHAPFTFFYREPRNRQLTPTLLKWRAHLNGQPALLDTSGIRTGLRTLRKGGMMGILPDQEPDRDNGVFAPFFEENALTMTLLAKLVRRSGAHVILCVSERLDHAQGWRVHYLQADPLIASEDLQEAAAAINRDVERCIELCPEQYLWDYKRFNAMQNGGKRDYSKSLDA